MSTEPLDDAALAKIEARCDAASDGPWDWWTDGEGRLEMFIPDGTMGAEVLLSYADFRDCEDCGRPSREEMNFIAAARSDVPALVAALRAERAKTQRVRELCADSDKHLNDSLPPVAAAKARASGRSMVSTNLIRAALEGGTDERSDDEKPDFITTFPSGTTEVDREPWVIPAEVLRRLDEFQRVRDRGAAEGANYFIGGVDRG